jgi:tRNA threonylcarbamoyladenosine biosynthesis protein TsaB
MALILSIDTSTAICSVAIHQEGKLLASNELFVDKTHSENLAAIIQHLMQYLGFCPQDFDAFAVSKGPGSYTGLRIGVSTAKGLCFANDKPLIAIGSLEAMAYQFKYFNPGAEGTICTMLDARRMEVFCAMFDATGSTYVLPTEAHVVEENSFEPFLSAGPVYFVGNSNEKVKAVIHHPQANFVSHIYPSAKYIGYLAEEAFAAAKFEDLAYFEPYYLKEFMSTSKKQITV